MLMRGALMSRSRLCNSAVLIVGCASVHVHDVHADQIPLSRTQPQRAVPLACVQNPTNSKVPTVVLIHGLNSAKETWKRVGTQLTAANIPNIAVDLRGHGESPLGDDEEAALPDFSPRALCRDIEQTLKDRQVEGPIVIVGHSMGARVALRYAADFPDQVAAVVMEDMDVRSAKARIHAGIYPHLRLTTQVSTIHTHQ